MLERMDERLRAVIAYSPIPIFLVNLEGRVRDLNPAAEKLFGFAPAELRGRSLHDAIHHHYPDGRPFPEAECPVSVLTGQEPQAAPTPQVYYHRDGSPLEALTSAGVIPGDGDSLGRIVYIVEQSDQRYQLLAQRMHEIREAESSRLARQVHDELGQSLAALRFELMALSQHYRQNRDQISEDAVAPALRMLDEISQTVRRISIELRPAMLDQLGLGPTLEWFAGEAQKRYQLRAEVTGAHFVVDLSPSQQTALYRITQEAIMNVGRHAQASRVEIRLSQDPQQVWLEIQDDGKGMHVDQLSQGRSVGLFSMHERARLAGGVCEISSQPGAGTTVIVRMRRLTPPAESGTSGTTSPVP